MVSYGRPDSEVREREEEVMRPQDRRPSEHHCGRYVVLVGRACCFPFGSVTASLVGIELLEKKKKKEKKKKLWTEKAVDGTSCGRKVADRKSCGLP